MVRLSTTHRVANAAILVAAFVCAPPTRADEPDTPADPYAAAVEQFGQSQWDEAVRLFREALKKQADDPRGGASRLYLAEALLRSNHPSDATIEYRKYLKGDVPDESRPTAEFRLAEALFLAGDKSAAVDAAQAFLDAHPSHSAAPRAWYYLGEAAYATGDYELAEQALTRLTADFPDDPQADRAELLRAACLLQTGRVTAAWAILSPRLDEKKRDPLVEQLAASTLAMKAEEAAAAGRLDDAEADYDRLLKSFPRHERAPYATYRRAQLSAVRGDWQTAAERFAVVVERSDLDDELMPLARLGQLQALAQDRRWDEAIDVAADARRVHAAWPQVYEFDYLRGRALVARAELNEARTAFAEVLKSKPATGTETAVLARYLTAETHFLQQSYEAALAEYERVAADGKFAAWQDAARRQCDQCRERLGRTAGATNLQRK